ncbi:MAG: hypothetical protein ACR2QE_01215, partial [Acidimicrobiales bacterium]
REPSDWPVLRRGSAAAALGGLRQAYRMVVIDTDADVTGEQETGSRDLEDRNALTRAAIDAACLVMVVGRGSLQGLHRHVRITRRLVDAVRPSTVLVPVINNAARPGAGRRELTRAFSLLAESGHAVANPVFVGHQRHLEGRLRDGAALPRQLVKPVSAAAARLLAQAPLPDQSDQYQPVEPGELGRFSDDGEAA